MEFKSARVANMAEWLLLVTLISCLLIVLPFFDNFILATKLLILFVASILAITLFVLQSWKRGAIQLSFSSLTSGLVFFGIVILASTLLAGPYPIPGLLGTGGMYLSFVLIAMLGGSLLPKKHGQHFFTALAAGGTALSVTTFLQAIGLGPSNLINAISGINLPATLNFNLTGSPFVAAQILGVSLLALVGYVVLTKHLPKYMLAAGPIMLLGFLINAWICLPGKEAAPILLPFTAGWSIAIDTLRFPKSALIGVGPENFDVAFTQFKPAWLNGSDLWATVFTQSTNLPLTLLTTTGLFGLIAWLVIMYQVFLRFKKADSALSKALSLSVLAIATVHLVFAPNPVTLTIQAIALAYLIAQSRDRELYLHPFAVSIADSQSPWHTPTKQLPAARFVLVGLGLLLIGAATIGVGRAYAASYYVLESLKAAQKNDGVGVYQAQQKAVQLNPYIDLYRQQYAQINLQIAAALANKTDVTEEEKQQIGQLIQQSIREARAASTLNPDRSNNWAILARIYRNLIGVATDADQWTVSAYVQAIQRAPADPNLRIELGGVFFNQGSYQQALSLFQQASQLKADMPNAYYNQANSLKKLGELEQAKIAYQQTLTLLPADSEGYTVASKELAELEAEIAAQPKADDDETGTPATSVTTEEPSAAPAASGSAQRETPLSILDQNVTETAPDTIQPPAEDVTVNP